MKTTSMATNKDIKQNWVKFDANGKVLGSLAVEIAHLLMGKHKPNYVPYLNSGDKVVVVNCEKVVLTGTKELNKLYHSHSQYKDGQKTKTAAQIRELKPERLIYEAVKGMLPKNRLRDVRLANLYIYEGEEHPHQGQLPNN